MDTAVNDSVSLGTVLLSAKFFSSDSRHMEEGFSFVLFDTALESDPRKVVQIFRATSDDETARPFTSTSYPEGGRKEVRAVCSEATNVIEEGCRLLESLICDMTGGDPILSRINLSDSEYVNHGRQLRREYQTPLTVADGEMSTDTLSLST